MDALKMGNLALAFILELGALASFAYWGFQTEGSGLLKAALGLGLPLLVAVVWGIFLAPHSTRRVKDPLHLLLQIIVFGAAAVCLFVAGQQAFGLIFWIVALANVILLRVWRQEPAIP